MTTNSTVIRKPRAEVTPTWCDERAAVLRALGFIVVAGHYTKDHVIFQAVRLTAGAQR